MVARWQERGVPEPLGPSGECGAGAWQAALAPRGLGSGSGRAALLPSRPDHTLPGRRRLLGVLPRLLGCGRCRQAAPVASDAGKARADTSPCSLTDYLSGGFSSFCLRYLPSVPFGLFVCLKEDEITSQNIMPLENKMNVEIVFTRR